LGRFLLSLLCKALSVATPSGRQCSTLLDPKHAPSGRIASRQTLCKVLYQTSVETPLEVMTAFQGFLEAREDWKQTINWQKIDL
jgi:hypothetical protein